MAEETEDGLRDWVHAQTGIEIARESVCPGHSSVWDCFKGIYVGRPPLALVLGSRGSGKSFLAALNTHLNSLKQAGHGTRILGGSRAQSDQVYRAIREIVHDGRRRDHPDHESNAAEVVRLLKSEATYFNGSEVAILAASSTSVRGPHVPSLVLDEVDEIPSDLRDAAMGMCMDRHGISASVLMTSTWHRVNGPMTELMERGKAGEFPVYTFCAFEVLQNCPEERSGPGLEKCPECALVPYCHDVPEGTLPKAKRSHGHYGIDSLIQKVRATSARTFEADYLCMGPRADGLWFPGFSGATHVSPRAEYDPLLPVNLAIDSGVFTGAVFFQVVKDWTPDGVVEGVHVFADHLAEGLSAELNAREIMGHARTFCGGRLDVISTDPAGGHRNPVGRTVISEYERAGFNPMRRWPTGSVGDGLSLVESFVDPADGRSRLVVHPRCTATIRAMQNYRRAKRAGQWQDYPEDPQHPHEDLVDALRGGLRTSFPEGRTPPRNQARVSARKVF